MVKDKGGDKECLLKAMYAISCELEVRTVKGGSFTLHTLLRRSSLNVKSKVRSRLFLRLCRGAS